MPLVLDTDITKGFCEAIDVLDPTNEHKILRFVLELMRTAKSYENRLHEKNKEIECLMKSLDELEDKARETEEESDSVYDDEEDEDETQG